VRKLHAIQRKLEGWLLAAAMLVMAAATIVNVFARNLTGDTIAATEELNQFLIVVVCFVGLSYAAGEGRHVRMSALCDALPVRARRWLLAGICATTALLLFALAWYAASYALGVDRRSPVLGVPLGWVYLVAPAGLFLGGVQYAFAAARNVAGPGAYVAADRPDGYEELEAQTGDPHGTS
jgi:TRAP-type C4-dicarboxylate transport system permease small subunit